MTSEIKLVRLVSGEELIAHVSRGPLGASVILKDPAIVLPTKEATISLAQWVPYAITDGVEIYNQHILFTVDPQVDVTNYYLELTSGIVTKVQR